MADLAYLSLVLGGLLCCVLVLRALQHSESPSSAPKGSR